MEGEELNDASTLEEKGEQLSQEGGQGRQRSQANWQKAFRRVSHLSTTGQDLKSLKDRLQDPKALELFVSSGGLYRLTETINQLSLTKGILNVIRINEAKDCIRLCLNSPTGMKELISHKQLFFKFMEGCLDSPSLPIKYQVMEVLAAICLHSAAGRDKINQLLHRYGSPFEPRKRWQIILQFMSPETPALVSPSKADCSCMFHPVCVGSGHGPRLDNGDRVG